MSLGTVVTYGKNTVDENILWILLAVFLKVELYTRVGLENQKLNCEQSTRPEQSWLSTVFGDTFPTTFVSNPKARFSSPWVGIWKQMACAQGKMK